MPPENPPYLVVLDTTFGSEGLRGRAMYVKPRNGNLRVRWGVGEPPPGYAEHGHGVVFVADADEKMASPPDENAGISAVDGLYSYVEGLNAEPWLMLVMIVPPGYCLHGAAPEMVGARVFGDRLAFYWLLKADTALPNSVRVRWRLSREDDLRKALRSSEPATQVPFETHDPEAPKGFKIFLSYRDGDDGWAAGRLRDALRATFREDGVFHAPHSIAAGDDFRKALDEAVGAAGTLLAVIGSSWLDPPRDIGQRRLDDPADWVRLEISYALQRHKRVIPVVLDGASMPRAAALPEPLRELAYRQARVLRKDRFDDDVRALIEELESFQSST